MIEIGSDPHSILTKLLNHLLSNVESVLHEERNISSVWILGVEKTEHYEKHPNTVSNIIRDYRSEFLGRFKQNLTIDEIDYEVRRATLFVAQFGQRFKEKKEEIRQLINEFLDNIGTKLNMVYNVEWIKNEADVVLMSSDFSLIDLLLSKRRWSKRFLDEKPREKLRALSSKILKETDFWTSVMAIAKKAGLVVVAIILLWMLIKRFGTSEAINDLTAVETTVRSIVTKLF